MISNRLKSISSLINDGEDITDVGCDHALLDIYLTLNKNCCCHCCDVNQGIIDRAISNIQKYNLEGFIDVFVGNGFDDLHLNFNSVMVLSGMGTSTILKILKKNRTCSIICQTNTDLYVLRKSICDMGYYIVSEDLVFDNNRFYVSIRFGIGKFDYSFDELLLGPCLLNERNLLFNSYVNDMYCKLIKGYNKSIEFNSDGFDELNRVIKCLEKYISA